MTKQELLRHCEHKPHSLPCYCIDFYIANFYEINRLRKAEVIENEN